MFLSQPLSFAVVIPEPILDEIASWCLPAEVEEALFARLEVDLEDGPSSRPTSASESLPTSRSKSNL